MANLIRGWPTLKRLLRYGKDHKKIIIIAFSILFIASCSEILGPVLISYFINNILTKKILKKKIILIFFFLYLITQITSMILNYFQTVFFNKIAIKIIQKLRIEIISSTLYQPLFFFNEQPIGKIVSIITNDTEVIKELYDTVLTNIFKNISLISVTLFTMYILNWKMAIISTILFPLVVIIIFIYQYYSAPILRKIRIYLGKINHEFNEVINGMFLIQEFSQEKKFEKSIKYTSKLHYESKIKVLKLEGFLLRPLISFFSSLILCGLMVLFILSPNGKLGIGTLYAFISYLNRLNEPLITITTQQSILQQAIVAGERIFNIIDSKKQEYGNDSIQLNTGSINISNVNFQYNKKSPMILNNINLKINSKNFISIVGKTGSGKSTLINLLMGYYPVTNGIIYLDNRPISSLSYKVLRHGICMVQQEPIIFTGTIKSNITLGKNISKKEIWKVLKTVQLYSFVKSLPNQMDFILKEKGNNLSIGQKQLLSIARILILKPKILILDEATASIDSETEQLIQKTLISIRKKSTLIIIAHRLSTIIKSDKIVVLKNGNIVEIGNHKTLIKNKKTYYKMYNMK
ncbi:SmdB family multidrug efflux ABC transporter permease/ATP-binding protein [Buchnera aphidicola]|uniref:Multidrug resistance-like ATP-binding protein MdlB n=1 Tax=Buchnera aphidicola (Therioaphis trifolii) TaxID=1241884 RepID=A0A4D6YDJ7_9GAMM|nr:SmdB family multidrug efflux ABC transporter permease/ATP-binding protein [Buchnera aphidicola]QCI27299.1 SmdB family multidrug efflux ABC transporter permease/ATP-binding protein [Buchnera aphidicola (Therioaphis trifolii)]